MLMVPLLALIHGFGLIGMSHAFNLTDDALLQQRFSAKTIFLVAFMAILLFALHALEIGLVGLVYLSTGAARNLGQALVISASYYTTTGAAPDVLPDGWRLVGQAEALLGLLLIGWSTAFLVRKIDRLQERDARSPEEIRRRRLRKGGGYGGHESGAGD
jgi:hypothetical protein